MGGPFLEKNRQRRFLVAKELKNRPMFFFVKNMTSTTTLIRLFIFTLFACSLQWYTLYFAVRLSRSCLFLNDCIGRASDDAVPNGRYFSDCVRGRDFWVLGGINTEVQGRRSEGMAERNSWFFCLSCIHLFVGHEKQTMSFVIGTMANLLFIFGSSFLD